MRQRIDLNPTNNPSNSADAIYKLSRLSRQLAKWRYELAYKRWAKTIHDIQPERQLVVRNEDIPLKTKKPKAEPKINPLNHTGCVTDNSAYLYDKAKDRWRIVPDIAPIKTKIKDCNEGICQKYIARGKAKIVIRVY